MTELHRTLVEDVLYPPHDPRKASSEYRRVHKRLVYQMDEACWICGIRHSTGGAMETHHNHVEWAAANGIDLELIVKDFPEIKNGPALREWLDSEGNMLVLCATHHRGSRTGIHMVSYPAWVLQRYQGLAWAFITKPEAR